MRAFDGDSGDADAFGGSDGPRRAIALPDGVADAAAGSELATLLDGMPVEHVSGHDTVVFMTAAYRLATHYQGLFLKALLETGLRLPAPDDQVVRTEEPGEFAAEEARAALVWSRSRAEGTFGRAYEMFAQNPQIGHALLDARIDEPRAKAFCSWTGGLAEEHAARIIDELLPRAPRLTVSELIDRIKRMAIALDPDWAERRYRDSVRQRRVELRQNPEGTAELVGRDLPADRAKTGADRIHHLAQACKRAGDKRRIDTIRADLYLGMLDGQFQHLTDQQIIDHVLAHPIADDPTDPDTHDDHDPGNSSADGDDPGSSNNDGPGSGSGDGNSGGGPGGANPRDPGDLDDDDPGGPGNNDDPGGHGGPGGLGDDDGTGSGSGGAPRDGNPSSPDGGPNDNGDHRPSAGDGSDRRRATQTGGAPPPGCGHNGASAGTVRGPVPVWNVAELRVELSTLLGMDEHPAELPGLGYIPAIVARPLAARMGAAQWRFVICTHDGTPICSGITTHRPTTQAGIQRDTNRGGIVELQLSNIQLFELATATAGGQHTDWQHVIGDIVDRYRRGILDHKTTTSRAGDAGTPSADQNDARRRRRARAGLRRWVEVRDRYCVHPTCRMPASKTDQDHRTDYAAGGLTVEQNLDSQCRHDHKLQHDGGWRVHRAPGSDPLTGPIIWTSPLGHRYESRPPPVMHAYPEPDSYYPAEDDLPTWFTDLIENVKAGRLATRRNAAGADSDTASEPPHRSSPQYPAEPPF